MSTVELQHQIESLPADLRKEVEDFVKKLTEASKKKKTPRAELHGKFKGQIWMSPDFDEPLEDFKEYME